MTSSPSHASSGRPRARAAAAEAALAASAAKAEVAGTPTAARRETDAGA